MEGRAEGEVTAIVKNGIWVKSSIEVIGFSKKKDSNTTIRILKTVERGRDDRVDISWKMPERAWGR